MIIPIIRRSTRFLLLFFSVISISFASRIFDGFKSGPIVCPIRLLTGIPCPACGTTRSIGALCEGKFAESWSLNPFGIIIATAVLLWAARLSYTTKIATSLSQKYSTFSTGTRFVFLSSIYLGTWALNFIRIDSNSL